MWRELTLIHSSCTCATVNRVALAAAAASITALLTSFKLHVAPAVNICVKFACSKFSWNFACTSEANRR